MGRFTVELRGVVTCRACNGTGRSPHIDNACCDQCDGWGKRLVPVTLSGHEITNPSLLTEAPRVGVDARHLT